MAEFYAFLTGVFLALSFVRLLNRDYGTLILSLLPAVVCGGLWIFVR